MRVIQSTLCVLSLLYDTQTHVTEFLHKRRGFDHCPGKEYSIRSILKLPEDRHQAVKTNGSQNSKASMSFSPLLMGV